MSHYVSPGEQKINDAWDRLMELGVSEETLQCVTNINGWSIETMESILYATTGYRSFEQVEGEPGVDF